VLVIMRGDDRPRDPLVRAVLFPLGQLSMTPGVAQRVPPSEMLQALRSHARGEWGELVPDDLEANDRALKEGARIFSAYSTKAGIKFWIITEADRSVTTVLLPEEY
jgi:hypothetical protein